MAASLCKKECQTGCDKKGKEPPNDFKRGERKWDKCYTKCENKCSKKYFNKHCMALCDDGPALTAEESRKLVKDYEARVEKKLEEMEAAGINIYKGDALDRAHKE